MKSTGPEPGRFKWLVALAGCVVLASCVQRAGVVSDTEQPFYDHRPAGHQSPVETYLEMKHQELSGSCTALKAAGLDREIDAIHRLVNRGDRFSAYDVVGETPQQRADVVRMLTLTTVHYLASVGMTVGKIEASKTLGIDVPASAVGVIAGGAGFDDLMAVSEMAMVAVVSGARCFG